MMKEYLQKLQNLPSSQKKIILWVTVGLLAIIFLIIWIKLLAVRLDNLGSQNIINSIIPVK